MTGMLEQLSDLHMPQIASANRVTWQSNLHFPENCGNRFTSFVIFSSPRFGINDYLYVQLYTYVRSVHQIKVAVGQAAIAVSTPVIDHLLP